MKNQKIHLQKKKIDDKFESTKNREFINIKFFIQLNPALTDTPATETAFNRCKFIVPSTCFHLFPLLAITEFHL